MSVLTRRTVLRSFAAASALPVIGAPMIARAAEIELKYGNNLPLSHPLNIRAQEAAERVARRPTGGSRSRSSRTTSSVATPTC